MRRPSECSGDNLPIYEKIKLARDLLTSSGEPLWRTPHIRDLLERLDRCIEASWKTMFDLGIVETCKHCDEDEEKSCCARGFHDKFDAYQLLMNLLLGASLPDNHLRPESCYFLTDRGCSLKVRLLICVDYLCPKILDQLSHDELIRLQSIYGDELVTGFIAYDAIKKYLKGYTREANPLLTRLR